MEQGLLHGLDSRATPLHFERMNYFPKHVSQPSIVSSSLRKWSEQQESLKSRRRSPAQQMNRAGTDVPRGELFQGTCSELSTSFKISSQFDSFPFFCSAASAEQNIEDITPAAEKDLLWRDPVFWKEAQHTRAASTYGFEVDSKNERVLGVHCT